MKTLILSLLLATNNNARQMDIVQKQLDCLATIAAERRYQQLIGRKNNPFTKDPKPNPFADAPINDGIDGTYIITQQIFDAIFPKPTF